MNGGNQMMMALNLHCHIDVSHWLRTIKALQLANQIHNGLNYFFEGSIHKGLKFFLKQPKLTMGWNLFWRLNLQWVEIVSEATQIHNGLKSFLKAQFTMGLNCFWYNPSFLKAKFTELIQVPTASSMYRTSEQECFNTLYMIKIQ